jgi:hypothetical protein
MDDRRQLTRKEPVEIWAPSLDRNIIIKPLPWRKRNDLGNLIVVKLGEAIDATRSEDRTRVLGELASFYDYAAVMNAAQVEMTEEELDQLTFEELVSLCHWIVEANGLESLLWVLDPEVSAPSSQQEETTGPADGAKTESTEDSSLPESAPES